MSRNPKSRVVVVTGASTGIGADIAETLAKRGYLVVAGVRSQEDFRRMSSNPDIQPLIYDVTRDDHPAIAIECLRQTLDDAISVHLINNAGIAVAGPLESVSIAQWRQQLEVNVLGLVRTTQAFLPWIRKTKGTIINMGSISGRIAPGFLGPYCSSKFAVEAISDSLRREMRAFGVNVVLIEPGPVDTPIWNKGLSKKDEMRNGLSPELANAYEGSLETFLLEVEKSARDAVPAEFVTRAVIKSLETKNPPARVLVAKPGIRLIVRLASFLPDRFLDRMV